jgi:hypothetical protein
MRRVVSEQIKALNELTEIVARSGRAFDVAEPASLISPTRPPDPPAPRRSEPRPAEPRPAEPRVPEPTPASDPPRYPEPAAREVQTRPRPPMTRSPQIARAEERPPAQAQDRSHDGWLTDLLARASREEREETAPRQQGNGQRSRSEPNRAIDSIDALSLDIARLLDHDAVADLWDRYRRGERHVFSPRLYTAQGQQAFDEIRRRYHSDGVFRETVDRYILEFERLLTEVSRDDPDSPLAKTYLTSETGKVYTMLAHAAERFE